MFSTCYPPTPRTPVFYGGACLDYIPHIRRTEIRIALPNSTAAAHAFEI